MYSYIQQLCVVLYAWFIVFFNKGLLMVCLNKLAIVPTKCVERLSLGGSSTPVTPTAAHKPPRSPYLPRLRTHYGSLRLPDSPNILRCHSASHRLSCRRVYHLAQRRNCTRTESRTSHVRNHRHDGGFPPCCKSCHSIEIKNI